MKKINNNSINIKNLGEEVELYGWASKVRNLGGLVFIDLRDRSGIIQLVINPDNKFYDLASTIKSEYVIKACGKVIERSNKNPNMATGDIEVEVSNLEILNTSNDIPFPIANDITALEENNFPQLETLNLRHNLISDISVFERMDFQKSKLYNLYLENNKIDKEVNSSLINKLRVKIHSVTI